MYSSQNETWVIGPFLLVRRFRTAPSRSWTPVWQSRLSVGHSPGTLVPDGTTLYYLWGASPPHLPCPTVGSQNLAVEWMPAKLNEITPLLWACVPWLRGCITFLLTGIFQISVHRYQTQSRHLQNPSSDIFFLRLLGNSEQSENHLGKWRCQEIHLDISTCSVSLSSRSPDQRRHLGPSDQH